MSPIGTGNEVGVGEGVGDADGVGSTRSSKSRMSSNVALALSAPKPTFPLAAPAPASATSTVGPPVTDPITRPGKKRLSVTEYHVPVVTVNGAEPRAVNVPLTRLPTSSRLVLRR